jgi:hypothetical protein
MTKNYDLDKIIIKKRGFYDQSKLIKNVFEWYKKNDFFSDVKKFKLSGSTVKYTFEGEKKVTDYLKWFIKCFFIIYDFEEVEIIKEGKKIKTNHAKLHCEITGRLEVDWQNRYGKGGKIITFLGDFLRKYILRYKIDDLWCDEIALKMEELSNEIKKSIDSEVV